MKRILILLFPLVVAVWCLGQSPPAKWQVATIMASKAHVPAPGEDSSVVRYDVTLRVANTEYVVLYAPPDGTPKDIVKYRLGIDGLVLVGTDTIKYNDMLGITREVSIISRRNIPSATAEGKLKTKQ